MSFPNLKKVNISLPGGSFGAVSTCVAVRQQKRLEVVTQYVGLRFCRSRNDPSSGGTSFL
jgi:hypothetical protein